MNGYVPLFQAIFDEDDDAPKPRPSKVNQSRDFKDFAKEFDSKEVKKRSIIEC